MYANSAEFAYTGNPGKGRDKDLPKWSSWDLGSANKYLVLDSENDQGVYMSNIEYTKDYLLNKLSQDSRFSDSEKCETLFGLSYGDGNGVSSEELFRTHSISIAVRETKKRFAFFRITKSRVLG